MKLKVGDKVWLPGRKKEAVVTQIDTMYNSKYPQWSPQFQVMFSSSVWGEECEWIKPTERITRFRSFKSRKGEYYAQSS